MRFGLGVLLGFSIGIVVCIFFASVLFTTFPNNGKEQPTTSEPSFFSSSQTTRSSLQHIIHLDSPTQRFLEIHALTESLNDTELVDLIEESTKRIQNRRTILIQNMLFEQLAKSNPKEALEQVWYLPQHRWIFLLDAVFAQWSALSLKQALTNAISLKEPYRTASVKATLDGRNDLSDAELVRTAKEFGIERIGVQIAAERQARELIDEPLIALDYILHDSVDNELQVRLVKQIIEVQLSKLHSQDQIGRMVEVLFNAFSNDETVFHELVLAIAEYDPAEAWQQMLNMPQHIQQRTLEPVIEACATVDPNQTLLAIAKIAQSRLRKEAGRLLMLSWARHDTTQLLTNIEMLPQEFRDMGLVFAIRELTRKGLFTESIQYLDAMEAQGINVQSGLQNLVNAWSKDSALDAVHWVMTQFSEDTASMRDLLNPQVLGRLAIQDPSKAMDIAHLISHNESSLVSADIWIIDALAANGRFDEAKKLLNRVRSPMKEGAIFAIGNNLIERDFPVEAIKLAEELPESHVPRYFQHLTSVWIYTNPKQLVEHLLHLPNEEIQALVAREILSSQRFSSVQLSDEQNTYVKTFVQPVSEN